jgi:hypothetical protein
MPIRGPAVGALLMVVVLVSCVAFGQEGTGPNADHLKCFRQFIGTWRYEGPLLEDIPNVAKKGSKFVFQISWRLILDNSVVEENWSFEYEGGLKIAGKGLTGWNAEEGKLVNGVMDSLGGMGLGTLTFNSDAKSATLTTKGIDGKGKEVLLKVVGTKIDKDTLRWQALERAGGLVQGESPVYTLKRVKRPQAATQAK